MREHDDNPKKPHPVHVQRKGSNALESDERVDPLRKDRDHHRHMRC